MCAQFSVNDFPKATDFEEISNEGHFEIKMLKLENGKANAGSNKFPFLRSINLFWEERAVVFLLFIAGFTAAVIPYCSRCFLFHSYSRNQQKAMVPKGISDLLEVSHLVEVEQYNQKVYIWDWNQVNVYFKVQYIDIVT